MKTPRQPTDEMAAKAFRQTLTCVEIDNWFVLYLPAAVEAAYLAGLDAGRTDLQQAAQNTADLAVLFRSLGGNTQ